MTLKGRLQLNNDLAKAKQENEAVFQYRELVEEIKMKIDVGQPEPIKISFISLNEKYVLKLLRQWCKEQGLYISTDRNHYYTYKIQTRKWYHVGR